MKTHPWSEIQDCLKADPARWERIQVGKAALRAMRERSAPRERQEMTQTHVSTLENQEEREAELHEDGGATA